MNATLNTEAVEKGSASIPDSAYGRSNMNLTPFRDRTHAGQVLAGALTKYADAQDVLVLGLPRGGVPVAYEVAENLHAPLDVIIVRKLGVPGQEELAMGAIASGGIRVLNEPVVLAMEIPPSVIERAAAAEQMELQRRELACRGTAQLLSVDGKTVILVDDGIATGATLYAAIQVLREQQPKRIVIAVPTASADAAAILEPMVDEFVALITPENFRAVGLCYDDFQQTTDEQVKHLLRRAHERTTAWPPRHQG